jgi:uncharacterized RDD family membrane protein YckC
MWYYSRNQKNYGPVSLDELKSLYGRGELSALDHVCQVGEQSWRRADAVLTDGGQARTAPRARTPTGDNPFAAPESDLAPEDFRQGGGKVVYARFLQRVGASFVDGLLVLVVTSSLNFALFAAFGPSALAPEVQLAINLLDILIGWLYSALQESSAAQATLGKRAAGIKVVDEQGRRISFGKATGRHFGKVLSLLIAFIGFLMMMFDKKSQCLHDKLAGTYVVQK